MLKLNREAYEALIAEDIAWLEKQQATLERGHILLILRCSADQYYGPKTQSPSADTRSLP